MLSLGAMRHFDFNFPRAYSYEQAIETMRYLNLGQDALEQQVRRTFVNVVIRNQDDRVKNVAYLMDKSSRWTLSPAFDVAYAYNPDGEWTSQHQMSLNGKTSDFRTEDLLAFAKYADLKTAKAKSILAEVLDVARDWPTYSVEAGVPPELADGAYRGFRLDFDLK